MHGASVCPPLRLYIILYENYIILYVILSQSPCSIQYWYPYILLATNWYM